jgi:hypothetical protein
MRHVVLLGLAQELEQRRAAGRPGAQIEGCTRGAAHAQAARASFSSRASASLPMTSLRSTRRLWKPGVLEEMATEAGLEPGDAFDITWAYEYPDFETLGRAMMAPAGIAVLVGPEREAEVRAAIVEGLAPFRTELGSYRLQNEFRCLIAHA